jgi:hypothetical protein
VTTTVLVPAALRRLRQLGLQPGAAGQALLAHGLGVEGLAVARGGHQAHEVAGGPHRAFALGGAEEVEVAPARDADEAHPLAVGGVDHGRFAVQQPDAQAGTVRAQRRQACVDVAAVELVVAGHEDHRHRPAGKTRQPGPGGVDVAGQHQQLGAGRGLGSKASVSRCRSDSSCSFTLQIVAAVQTARRAASMRASSPAARPAGGAPVAGTVRRAGQFLLPGGLVDADHADANCSRVKVRPSQRRSS